MCLVCEVIANYFELNTKLILGALLIEARVQHVEIIGWVRFLDGRQTKTIPMT